MRPADGELQHFSDDPGIDRFVPHVAATAAQPLPLVWAVDAHHAPSYWLPRQCPRAMAWRTPVTAADDAARILGPGGGDRVHGIEYRWLEARAGRRPAGTARAGRDPAARAALALGILGRGVGQQPGVQRDPAA